MKFTLLSFGGGQDSTAILLKMIEDKDFRAKYAPEKLVVVMSDTGNEHPYTYEHVKGMQKLCEKNDIEFVFLTSDMGFHTEAWPDLITPQMRQEGEKFKATMVQLGTKSCTDKLKIGPIYKFLDEYVNEMMGYEFNIQKTRGCNKRALKKFYKENGKIRVLIGFAKGEERRAEKSNKIQERDYAKENDEWNKALSREYPLIDIGMDRADCQAFITSVIGYCPKPSNCMLCPYQSDQELTWLQRNYPEWMETWYQIEDNKLKRYEGTEKNYGVYCTKKTLRERVAQAIEKYGDWSDQDLDQYKMSHGCKSNAM